MQYLWGIMGQYGGTYYNSLYFEGNYGDLGLQDRACPGRLTLAGLPWGMAWGAGGKDGHGGLGACGL